MQQMLVRYRLPVSYSTEIGRFITRWAHLEWTLSETLYMLMGLNPKLGRIAVREPSIDAHLTMMQSIANLRGIAVSVNWGKLKTIMKNMESFRNKIAHGIWLKDPSSKWPTIRLVKGTYIPKQGAKPVDARISPASLPVPFSELKNAVRGIDHANQMATAIKREVEAQVSP